MLGKLLSFGLSLTQIPGMVLEAFLVPKGRLIRASLLLLSYLNYTKKATDSKPCVLMNGVQMESIREGQSPLPLAEVVLFLYK